jgi:hypothetical protein
MQNRLGNILEDVELTDLMGHVRPQLMERPGVQLRAVGSDTSDGQATRVQPGLEVRQEAADVVPGRVVFQDPEGQAEERSVVDQREHAERAVVQLIDGEIAAEERQCALEVNGVNGGPAFFPPQPRPNSGWWPGGQRRGVSCSPKIGPPEMGVPR